MREQKIDTPILVTGAPRTGTTLVGTILGLARRVGTIFEPFHPDAGGAGINGEMLDGGHDPSGNPLRVEFPYITADHPLAPDFNRLFRDVLTGRARFKSLTQPGRHGWLTAWA